MNFIIITLVIAFLCNLFGLIYTYLVLYTDFFSKVKIQKRKLQPELFFQRLPLIAFNVFLLFTLSAAGLYLLKDFFILNTVPSVGVFFIQLIAILLIDDLYFYCFHRSLHQNKYLLKKIHSIHHRAATPFPLEYIYVHPLEWIGGAIGSFLAVIILQEVNIYAFWAYVMFRNLHEIDIHSGVRSTISQYIPLLGTTEHHDLHHSKINGNFASTFNIWDKIFGTKIK